MARHDDELLPVHGAVPAVAADAPCRLPAQLLLTIADMMTRPAGNFTWAR